MHTSPLLIVLCLPCSIKLWTQRHDSKLMLTFGTFTNSPLLIPSRNKIFLSMAIQLNSFHPTPFLEISRDHHFLFILTMLCHHIYRKEEVHTAFGQETWATPGLVSFTSHGTTMITARSTTKKALFRFSPSFSRFCCKKHLDHSYYNNQEYIFQ